MANKKVSELPVESDLEGLYALGVDKNNRSVRVLLECIQSLLSGGMTFGGIATPDTEPAISDQNVFYLATKPGTYVNFGGVEVAKDGLYILKNAANVWQLIVLSTADGVIKLSAAPDILFRQAKFLYTENTRTTDSGLLEDSTALSSGYIPVNEGDVVTCINGYSTECSFYDLEKKNRVLIAYPAVAPAGYPYAVIQYGYNNTGGYEEAYAQIIPYDVTKKIGFDAVNFITGTSVNSSEKVPTSQQIFLKELKEIKVDQPGTLLNSNNIFHRGKLVNMMPGSEPLFDEDTNFYSYRIFVDTLSKVSMYGIRIYCFADKNNIITSPINYINPPEEVSENVPEEAFFLYVSAYSESGSASVKYDKAKIGSGDSIPESEVYNFDIVVNGKKFKETLPTGLTESDLESEFYEHFKCEFGTITGSGEKLFDSTRVRCRIPLLNGFKINFSISNESFSRIASFFEKSDGSLVATSLTEPEGSEENIAYWLVLAKTGNTEIYYPEVAKLLVNVSYIDLPILEKVSLLEREIASEARTDSVFVEKLQNLKLKNQHLERENIVLKSDILSLRENMSSLLDAKSSSLSDSNVVPLNNNGEKCRFILGLHKCENNKGYLALNDVYLPHAKNDFSDVRIKDDKGNYLPYDVIFSGNIDILPDDRLPDQIVHVDSSKNMYGRIRGSVDRIKMSSDGGYNWSEVNVFNDLSRPVVAWISSTTDTMLVGSEGILYRSEAPYVTKEQVLDLNQYHDGSTILSHSMVQHPDGELFIGSYQEAFDARIFKSTDDGKTWTQVYQTSDYQHVHNMSIDINKSPVAIYAGLDGGGAILKTIDKGDTWQNLRDSNEDIPQSTDYGMIYSDPSGYRLFGGETSIVGGYSILKSTDDNLFTPVLSVGKAVYFVKKMNGILFAGALSSGRYRTTEILISYDDGETWKTAYTSSKFASSAAASDGFRYLSQDTYAGAEEEQIIVGCQGSKKPLRIFAGGNHYYSQIIVDVPKGCSSLTVEDGYLLSNKEKITNNAEISTLQEKILYIPLDFKENFISYYVNGILKKTILDDVEYVNGFAKHLGSIYPYIYSPENKISADFRNHDTCIYENLDLSEGNYHIGFWMRSNNDTRGLNLISSPDCYISINNSYQLRINDTVISTLLFPVVRDVMVRVDINIAPDFKVQMFVNGETNGATEESYTDLQKFKGELMFLKADYDASYNNSFVIQHFEITKGNISKEDAENNYYDGLFDNMI